MEETGVARENHPLTTSHWQLSHTPWVGFYPGEWKVTASSQWQLLRPRGHWGRPSIAMVVNMMINTILLQKTDRIQTSFDLFGHLLEVQ